MQPVKLYENGSLGPTAEEQTLLAQFVTFNGRNMTVEEAVQKGYLAYDANKGEFRITAKAKKH